MSLFAALEPDKRGDGPRFPETAVREAVPADGEAIAAIIAAREQMDLDVVRPRVAGELATASPTSQLFAAEEDGVVLAYGRVRRLDNVAPEGLPEGWYLLGLGVAPAHRRRGIGTALTHARLTWLAARTKRVFYFSNIRNPASIALHTAVGFKEVTRQFKDPRFEFSGGIGALFMLER
jgi:ribosomal protein S18 acetylase RimI-like enzyme